MLLADGSVWAFGANDQGQCGGAAAVPGPGLDAAALAAAAKAPARVPLPGGAFAVNLSSVFAHAVATCADGTAFAWGRNADKQISSAGGASVGVTQLKAGGAVLAAACATVNNTFLIKRPDPMSAAVLGSADAYVTGDVLALCTRRSGANASTGKPREDRGALLVRLFRLSSQAYIGDRDGSYDSLCRLALGDEAAAEGAVGFGSSDGEIRLSDAYAIAPSPSALRRPLLPVACFDRVNGVVWSAGLVQTVGDAQPTLALGRYEATSQDSEDAAAGAATAVSADTTAVHGRTVLRDPRFTVPIGPSTSIPPVKAAVALLAILDSFADKAAAAAAAPSPDSDAATTAGAAPGRAVESAPKAKVVAPVGKASAAAGGSVPMAEVHRFGVDGHRYQSGWGMGGLDCICIKVCIAACLWGLPV